MGDPSDLGDESGTPLQKALPFTLQRLSLRRLSHGDLEAFHAYRSDPEVARFQGWSPMNRHEAAGYLRAQAMQDLFVPGAWRQIAIAELHGDLLVGDAGIWVSEDSRSAEFGLTLTPAAQGKGYGTECVRGLIDLIFAATPVNETVAATYVRNLPCLAALRRSGMRLSATRQAAYKGELCMEQIFSVLRDGR